VEKEQPCVLLVDEIEKAFAETEDSGVTARLLGQLLWWLSEHRSRVLTVMTANALTVPPELFRAGRIDLTMTIKKLGLSEAKVFAQKVLQSIAGPTANGPWMLEIVKEINAGPPELAHAEVAELVYKLIKRHKWLI
jgi:SpoVK/Ycf46/Vps4 family AAA+-type ATPase